MEAIGARGWYPARWAHHPQPIKAAIRRLGWRPQVKHCWQNSQRLLLDNDAMGLGLGLGYREGWVTVTFDWGPFTTEHGWLVYRGAVLDLTLPPEDDTQYYPVAIYDAQQVRQAAVSRGWWGRVSPGRVLAAGHPQWAQRRRATGPRHNTPIAGLR